MDFKVDVLQYALPGLIIKAHAREPHRAAERWRTDGAWKILDVGCLLQDVQHALACGGRLGQSSDVLGEVLHWLEGILEVGEKNQQIAGAERVAQHEPPTAPQHECRPNRDEHVNTAFEIGFKSFGLYALCQALLIVSGKRLRERLLER